MAKANIKDWTSGLSPEERVEHARQAGQKSGATRRAHRLFRDIAKEILATPMEPGELADALEKLGLDANRENAMMLAAANKAALGDIEALRFLRDTVGEKPTEAFNIGVTGKPIKSLDLSGLSDEELEALADSIDG